MSTPNKALILAAGVGNRLAPITDRLPKSLVPINGKPIIFKQVENLIDNGVSDITIVAGYKSDMLEEAIHGVWPEIHIVNSTNYSNTNNMYSAWLGIRSMFPDGSIVPFLMMNADVFFDSSVLTELLATSSPNAVVVDIGRYIEESMKVVEKDGRLIAISKTITPEEAIGSSIDVYKFGIDGGRAFFAKCSEYIKVKNELRHWSEVALNDAFAEAEFRVCQLVGRWVEIDNLQDLTAAIELFSA